MPMSQEAYEIDRALSDAFWHMVRFIAPALTGPKGTALLTIGQLRVLRALDDEGPLPMSVVAAVGGVTRGSATGLIDRLVARNLVRRYEDQSNRRLVLVELLPEGHEVLAVDREKVLTRFHSITQTLDPEQRQEWCRMLEGVSAFLKKASADEVPVM